ncbi:MAG TPA: hypothetical protein PKV21_03750 [bacterium]|nr:hypothetical protein [bacterium]
MKINISIFPYFTTIPDFIPTKGLGKNPSKIKLGDKGIKELIKLKI